ncbi:MAG: VWA domain-containing protein [Planctomycetaceae bacterium]|nr:VWA domain-containing protein [Planctomycetaceae bacterium]
MTTHNLVFMTTPATVIISVLIVLATIGISFYSWKRTHYRRAHGLQELLRVVIVILTAILFNQPEWVEEYRPEEQPTVAILWDGSESMQTQDVVVRSSGETSPRKGTAISREEAVRPLLSESAWQGLGEEFDVVFQKIGKPESGQGTDLNTPLANVTDRGQNLMGVVLISDGDWNTGKPPVEAAARLRLKGVPVFGVAAGSQTRLPDVELVNVDLPTFGVSGKAVRIPFTIDSSLPREYLTTVTLKTSEGETLTKDVRINAMGRTSDSIAWKPESTGDYTLTLEIPRHGDETIVENNIKTAPIAIRQEKLQVLVVESYPRWEYRYLRNALSRDPGVEVACLLFHPGLSKTGGGSKDYIKQFPSGIEELAKFDVVFLGDVGLGEGHLTEEDCRLLKGLVEHQASGLVFLPGWQGRMLDLLNTELEELLPVMLDEGQPGGWGSRTASRFELTEKGRRSLLTKLADTQDENVQVWEDLPGFQWYAAVTRAKAGSDVLAVHGDIANEYGRLPLIATRTYGAGKVLFMGTDGAWRWRKGVEDKYHYRFWGQVVRWMAYQRNMAKGESMRLFYTPDQPQIRQTMALHAHVMEASGEPLSKGDVIARIVAPSGKTETVRLLPEGDEWGVFHGRYVPKESGQYDLVLACKQTSATLEAQFFVQGEELEQRGKPARPEVLEEIARVTGGKTVVPEDVDTIVSSLSTMPLPPPAVRRLQLWSHWASALLLVLLLGSFWVWRKVIGLV